MKVLSAIGRFFARIGRWIKETAWIQPLLIVGAIFAVIFAIPHIINGVKGWFNDSDSTNAFYAQYRLSLSGADNIKTGEDVLAIVFIECETGDCDVTGVDIDGDTIDMHLATHQLFSVAIDIAFGNGRYEYGRQYDDSEQDTYDPQDYFPRTFHIFKYYRQRQGGAFIVSSFVFL